MSKLELDSRCNVNEAVRPLVRELIDHAPRYRVGVSRMDNGVTLVDAGIEYVGGLAAGRLIGEICMGGLGHVAFSSAAPFAHWRWQVNVSASHARVVTLQGSPCANG